jgi:hypothetical protein
MTMATTGVMNVKSIRPLNDDERRAIGSALREYIANNGEKKAFAQKVILDEMLYELMWADVK